MSNYFNKINLIKINSFFIIFFLIFRYDLLRINKNQKLKVCLCTLGKKENKYIREFVEHYRKYGVDKIFLYDNNDIDGERFEEVINDYINEGFVELINWRGESKALIKIINNCYQNNHDIYDWLIFYEIDEFIYLKTFNNIKDFLSQKAFDKCKSIQLNWVHRSDNNQFNYQNKPLAVRFREKGENVKQKFNKLAFIKTIIRGHMNNITISLVHRLSLKIKGCDGFGKKANLKGILAIKPDYEYFYINHYYGKSVDEFIEKLRRGDVYKGITKNNNMYQLKKYFYINKITTKKLNYIEKKLGKKNVDLSEYRKKLKSKIKF